MKARRTGLVVEWVVEEDARRILLSSPPGTGCERSVSSCRFGATARGRALGTEPSPPLAPSQGCEQETTTAETTERRHEAGRLGRSLPLLSLPVRDASRRRRPQRRRSDGTRPGAWDGAFPSSRSQSGMRAGDDDRRDDEAKARGRALGMETSPPLAPSQGCEQGTTMAVPRGYERDEQIRSVLGRADPEQGPP